MPTAPSGRSAWLDVDWRAAPALRARSAGRLAERRRARQRAAAAVRPRARRLLAELAGEPARPGARSSRDRPGPAGFRGLGDASRGGVGRRLRAHAGGGLRCALGGRRRGRRQLDGRLRRRRAGDCVAARVQRLVLVSAAGLHVAELRLDRALDRLGRVEQAFARWAGSSPRARRRSRGVRGCDGSCSRASPRIPSCCPGRSSQSRSRARAGRGSCRRCGRCRAIRCVTGSRGSDARR